MYLFIRFVDASRADRVIAIKRSCHQKGRKLNVAVFIMKLLRFMIADVCLTLYVNIFILHR